MPRTSLETRQLITSMKTAEENMVWLQRHFDELLQQFKGQWVAVHKDRVVASDPDREHLLIRLREEHPDFHLYAIQLVTDKLLDLIL